MSRAKGKPIGFRATIPSLPMYHWSRRGSESMNRERVIVAGSEGHDQHIAAKIAARSKRLKYRYWSTLEGHHHFADPPSHALPRSQIERDALPAPIGDFNFDGNGGFGFEAMSSAAQSSA